MISGAGSERRLDPALTPALPGLTVLPPSWTAFGEPGLDATALAGVE